MTGEYVVPGQSYSIDDELVLWMDKQIVWEN